MPYQVSMTGWVGFWKSEPWPTLIKRPTYSCACYWRNDNSASVWKRHVPCYVAVRRVPDTAVDADPPRNSHRSQRLTHPVYQASSLSIHAHTQNSVAYICDVKCRGGEVRVMQSGQAIELFQAPRKISKIPSTFDTSPSSLMMWNLQSYPSTVLNERMWHF